MSERFEVFTRTIFREVFQKDVEETLQESIKNGAKRCAIEVEWNSTKNDFNALAKTDYKCYNKCRQKM